MSKYAIHDRKGSRSEGRSSKHVSKDSDRHASIVGKYIYHGMPPLYLRKLGVAQSGAPANHKPDELLQYDLALSDRSYM